MEIKDMNMKEIEARMAEIAKELDSPEADIDALETEVRSLNARKEELNKKAEKRTALLKSVEENGVVVRSFAEKKEERVISMKNTTLCYVGYLMQVKKGLYSLEDARRIAYETDKATKKLKDENLTEFEYIDKFTENALNELKCKFIKQFLKESL